MRISNFKNYVDWKNIKKKFTLVAISVAIGSMATGCNQNINSNQYINENNGIYQQLNEEKLDSNTTEWIYCIFTNEHPNELDVNNFDMANFNFITSRVLGVYSRTNNKSYFKTI